MKEETSDFRDNTSSFERFWSLDRAVTFLNHGAFGACPLPVLEAQQRLREQLEQEPLRFFTREFEELVSQLAARGVDTLVDGAHAPGMVPLHLHEIGATYYTGNCHKWLCAPKGAGFLYVRQDKQSAIRPMIISHGANSGRTDKSRFQLEFDWTGTDDPTAYLCIPEAIWFLGSLLPGGWPELMEQNRAKALLARRLLCETLGVSPPCPAQMIGSMAVVPLPDSEALASPPASKLSLSEQGRQLREWPVLQDVLFERFNIEVPVSPWTAPLSQMVRVSAQLYNTRSQYEYLGRALMTLLSE